MSWQINDSIDVTKVTLELSSDKKTLTVKEDGVGRPHEVIDLSVEPVGMIVVNNNLVRVAPQPQGLTDWRSTTSADSISLEVANTGAQGGATQWFFMIGEGDIRNGLTIGMHSVDGHQVDLRHVGGDLETVRH